MRKKIHLPDHQILARVALVLLASTLVALFLITCRLRGLSSEGTFALLKIALLGQETTPALSPPLAHLGLGEREPKTEKGRGAGGSLSQSPPPLSSSVPEFADDNLEQGLELPEPVRSLRRTALSQAQAGELKAAIELMGQALQLAPEEAILRREMSHLLSLAGWREFEAMEYGRAKGFFQEALYYWPKNLEALRGLAFSFFQERDRQKAEEWLLRFFQLGGDRPEAYTLMGRICYESDRLSEALHYLQISLAISPDQPEVREMVAKIQRELKIEASFDRTETRHFLIKYQGRALPATAALVEELLENAYYELGKDLGFYPQETIIVILYSDEQFRDVTRSPAWAGAVFDGKIRIPAKGLEQRTDSLVQIIRHEFTHALVHEATQGRAPVWLQEGLAQKNEPRLASREGTARNLVAGGGPFPLRSLESAFLKLPEPQAQLAYAESWLAVRFLEEKSGRFALSELLYHLSRGEDMNSSLRRVTGLDYEAFDTDFGEWVRGLSAERP